MSAILLHPNDNILVAAAPIRAGDPITVDGETFPALADIGVEPSDVGLENAGSTVTSNTPKPPKSAGERVTDEGDGGVKLAEYLVGQKII